MEEATEQKTYTAVLELDPGEMKTAQQKGCCVINGRVHHFIKAEVKKANERVKRAILSSALGKLPPIADVPVRVEITYWYGAWNVAASKRGELRPRRPDTDNLCKGLLDCITQCGVAWADDAQVASLIAEKRWLPNKEDKPYIGITVSYPAPDFKH